MAIDPFLEEVISLSHATRRLPKPRGKAVHPSTLWRWALSGLKAPDGQTVQLEVMKMGGQTCTSVEALRRFFDRLNAGRQIPHDRESFSSPMGTATVVSPSSSRRNRDIQIRKAERELRMSGFDGDYAVFSKSSASREVLCDVHEFLHRRLPTWNGAYQRAYETVRSGLFAHAAKILEGKCGASRSFATASKWIAGIDLLGECLPALPGVGPVTRNGWEALKNLPEFQTFLKSHCGSVPE